MGHRRFQFWAAMCLVGVAALFLAACAVLLVGLPVVFAEADTAVVLAVVAAVLAVTVAGMTALVGKSDALMERAREAQAAAWVEQTSPPHYSVWLGPEGKQPSTIYAPSFAHELSAATLFQAGHLLEPEMVTAEQFAVAALDDAAPLVALGGTKTWLGARRLSVKGSQEARAAAVRKRLAGARLVVVVPGLPPLAAADLRDFVRSQGPGRVVVIRPPAPLGRKRGLRDARKWAKLRMVMGEAGVELPPFRRRGTVFRFDNGQAVRAPRFALSDGDAFRAFALRIPPPPLLPSWLRLQRRSGRGGGPGRHTVPDAARCPRDANGPAPPPAPVGSLPPAAAPSSPYTPARNKA